MAGKNQDYDVIVVGAGLSGLACADLLHRAGLTTIVFEAADRTGGRIHSIRNQNTGKFVADLGPTWVWPQYQPIVQEWLDYLEIETFSQFEAGDGIYDFNDNTPVQRHPIAGQHGIRRVCGGSQSLIDALVTRLPQNTIALGQSVDAIKSEPDTNTVLVTTRCPEALTLRAGRVIVATPLRIACQNISWSPNLDKNVLISMQETPTWMATQAKAIALYDRPFWRSKQLSGRVASRVGPLMEVHDHSLPDGGQAALFGFVGWSFDMRNSHKTQLREEIAQQLIRCFGEEAGAYTALHIEDWASNKTISTNQDLTGPPAHPVVAPDILREPHFAGRLYFSVAETALQSPGFIEGALASANATIASLIGKLDEQ